MKNRSLLAATMFMWGTALMQGQTVNPPAVASAPSASPVVSLTDLPVLANKESETNKGGIVVNDPKTSSLFINQTYNGKSLAVGDKTYPKGLESIHGRDSWSYKLDGAYTSLVMDLGQDDGVALLQALGDGKVLYDSGRIPGKTPITAVVDVRGVKELQMTVIDNVPNSVPWNDKVVIGNPILLKRQLPDAVDTAGPGGSVAPQAKITATPTDGIGPLEVSFIGDQSKAPAGQVGRYTWYFGDGATETLAPNPKHTFTEPGLYEVVLQAQDDKGGIGVARQLITVRPGGVQPPISAVKVSAHVVKTGEAVQFDGTGSSSSDGTAVSYTWDFGDGQTGTGATVSHTYVDAKRYTPTLTVANKGGLQSKSEVSIKVTGANEPPVFPLQKGTRVLLIGNSLIGFCGPLDEWLKTLDKLSPQPLGIVTASKGKGLGKLVEYATWSKLAIHDKMEQGWDVVIIQPWLDAIDPNVSDDQLLKDCKTLVDWAREGGAYPVLYEPQLGWQNQEKDQARIHERVSHMAEVLDAGFIPAGQGWLQVAKDLPMKEPGEGRGKKETDPETLDGLMFSDFGHQSFTGALFNAMMIWKYLTGQSPTALTLSATSPGVNPEAVQRVVWDKLPYLEKVADQTITPAAQKKR